MLIILTILYCTFLFGLAGWDFFMLPFGSWFIANIFTYHFIAEIAAGCCEPWANDVAWYTNIANLSVVGTKAVYGQAVGTLNVLMSHSTSLFMDPAVFAHILDLGGVFTTMMGISYGFSSYETALTRVFSLINFYELVGLSFLPSSPYEDVEPGSVWSSLCDLHDRMSLIRRCCRNPLQLSSAEGWEKFYESCVYAVHLMLNVITLVEEGKLEPLGYRFDKREVICLVTGEPYKG